MKQLISCSNCERYVREHERACPFCHAALPEVSASVPARAACPAGLSRAAVFAMRTALVAAVPGAVACGAEEGGRERDTQQVASAGASAAGASAAQGGSSAAQGGSSAGGAGGGVIQLDDDPDRVADAGADAEPYAPIPIYGGVFPDPMSRARV